MPIVQLTLDSLKDLDDGRVLVAFQHVVLSRRSRKPCSRSGKTCDTLCPMTSRPILRPNACRGLNRDIRSFARGTAQMLSLSLGLRSGARAQSNRLSG